MKSIIVAEIERIAGPRLTPAMREEIADCAIRIIKDHNDKEIIAAVDSAKVMLVDAANKKKEQNT